MKFVIKPVAKQSVIIQTASGYAEVDQVPEGYVGIMYAGRITFQPVKIYGLQRELGKKIEKLTLEGFDLYGVIPLQDNGGIVDCLIDNFTVND